MKLEGSCHCGAVSFTVESPQPVPYMYCYCSICRKTAGAGGYGINLGAVNDTLQVSGSENLSVYQALLRDENSDVQKQSPARRHFCKICGSYLWVWDPRWPELLHPFASAIDTELPPAPEREHIMLDSKAGWVAVNQTGTDRLYPQYPEESLADWHRRQGREY